MASPFSVTESQLSRALKGTYEIRKQLRQGGQGIVFRATRVRNENGEHIADDVALKIYSPDTQIVRITREVDAMRLLRHPNLANLIDNGVVDIGGIGLHYVACEFIDGTALDHRLISGPPITHRTVAIIGRDVIKAILALWSKRIVHRDVGPKNIMLAPNGETATLIDLGIARHIGQQSLTSLGNGWGTYGYMSPEQAKSERQLTYFTDVFALGVTLQEALLGKHPTGGSQPKLSQPRPSTVELAPSAPVALCNLIDSMVVLRATSRKQARPLLDEFEQLVALQPR